MCQGEMLRLSPKIREKPRTPQYVGCETTVTKRDEYASRTATPGNAAGPRSRVCFTPAKGRAAPGDVGRSGVVTDAAPERSRGAARRRPPERGPGAAARGSGDAPRGRRRGPAPGRPPCPSAPRETA